jgi:hypothetical protein
VKRAICIALLVGASCLALQADATVLPAGTQITRPGTPTTLLSDSMFLLSRPDMEKATLALETEAIREEQIAKLTASYETLKTWAIVGAVALPVVAILLDEVVHALVGR